MQRLQTVTTVLLFVLPAAAQAKPTTAYPEVIPVFSEVSFDGRSQSPGRCTGTFIHPRLLLTASHCVRHFNASRVNGTVYRASDMAGNPAPDLTATPAQVYILQKAWYGMKALHPIRVHVSDAAIPVERGDLSLDYVEQDLAILEFAADAPNTREVADRAPGVGTPVIMMGFGVHGPRPAYGPGLGATIPPKQLGTNTLTSTDLDMLVTNGSANTCDNPGPYTDDWQICEGDSGGPLIDQASGKLLGVASASVTLHDDGADPRGKRKLSVYTDLTSPQAVEFVQGVLRSVGGP